jgi:MOSC domain-containing protein YiiM
MRAFDELESLWRASALPLGQTGVVRLIVLRRGAGVHETPEHAEMSTEHGIHGDRWDQRNDPDRQGQVTLMSARVAELIADGAPLDLPGDNLLVDLDLSAGALPIGARVRVGSALLEVSPMPHTGCRKFAERFGQDALRWVNWKEHRDRRLRGVNCRVLEPGNVSVGDRCQVE